MKDLPDNMVVEVESNSGDTNGEVVSVSGDGNNIHIIEDGERGANRGTWGNKVEFFLTCVAFAVGLGNVWRFPYLCFKNGGGAFLIPYVIMLTFMGLPLFYMELAFGQFASLGPISIWTISPLFKGVGYGMTCISWYISLFYNVIVATAFFYLFASFTSQLPWSTCNNWWNKNETCYVLGSGDPPVPLNETTSPAVEFYNGFVLQKSDGFENFGTPVWHLTLCLLFAWIVVVLALIKGVKSLGKVSYVTAIFPYIMLTVLLVRSAMLEGSLEGIKYYVTPDFSKLKNLGAWTDAATQIIFSLSCCNGGLIAMSSYNQFNNNCYRDAVTVAIINCLTSVFAGFVVFGTLGFMAHAKGVGVPDVVESGPGLVFMVYPEALNQMPIPVLWSILFFIMLVTLGLGSELALVETVLSAAQDEFRRYGLLKTWKSQFLFRAILCSINFLITIPMVCPAGLYLVDLLDSVMSGYPVLVISLLEMIIISYVYGQKQFLYDIKLMIGKKPNWFWRICWKYATPVVVFALLILLIVGNKPFGLNHYTYPTGIQALGQIVAFFPIFCVIFVFAYKYCYEGGFLLFRELLKPISAWGPAHDEHRTEFLQELVVRKLGPKDDFDQNEEGLPDAIEPNDSNADNAAATSGADIYPPATQQQALTCLINEREFYQSKISIAEKLTEKHIKDLAKQGVQIEGLTDGDGANPLEVDEEVEIEDVDDEEDDNGPRKLNKMFRRLKRNS